MKIIFITLMETGTVTIDNTVLKNNVLLAGPGSCPSCSASIATVAATGKQDPNTIIDFINDDIGRKYTINVVSKGSKISLTALASIITLLFIISLNLYPTRFEPIKIIAIGVEIFPRYVKYSSTAEGIALPNILNRNPIIRARILGLSISLRNALKRLLGVAFRLSL